MPGPLNHICYQFPYIILITLTKPCLQGKDSTATDYVVIILHMKEPRRLWAVGRITLTGLVLITLSEGLFYIASLMVFKDLVSEAPTRLYSESR